ncbi:hypothetical protein CHUAL_000331 [Chamberlinius hualienensis]
MSSSGSMKNGEKREEENQSQTHPKEGLVNQVCREWLVHEDGALAYRLQEKEIEQHYSKNREQRHLIRSDLREAHALHKDVVRDIIDNQLRRDAEDAELAMKLQQKLEKEETIHNKILELADEELAKKLQDEESVVTKKKRHPVLTIPSRDSLPNSSSSKKSLVACYEDTLVRATKNMGVETPVTAEAASVRSRSTSPHNAFSLLADIEKELDANLIPDVAKDEEHRLLQEVKDQEIASALQREETNPKALQYYLDQKLAIEAQDHELAIMLQEKERQKARRARQKRLQKSKTLEEAQVPRQEENPEDFRPKPRKATSYFDPFEIQRRRQEAEMAEAMTSHSRGSVTLTSVKSPRRMLERIEPPLQRSPNGEIPNVAAVLDPTYRPEMKSPDALPQPSGIYSPLDTRHNPYDNDDESSEDDYSAPDDFVAAPPYMPVQGQKRQTLEKKKKKENCKQQ